MLRKNYRAGEINLLLFEAYCFVVTSSFFYLQQFVTNKPALG
jgi:hypothetical protein